MKAAREVVLCVMGVVLVCLAGCGGAAPTQSPMKGADLVTLAESLAEEPEMAALGEGVVDELDLAGGSVVSEVDALLAAGVTGEPGPAILLHPRILLLERVLDRLDRIIERGQIAEAEKGRILERARTRLETSLSDEQKAQILQRVEARIDRVIEQGRLAEERKAEILGRAEEATARAVEEGRLTEERRAQILEQMKARIDAVIERGQVAEEQKAQILEKVKVRLETGLSDEEKAQVLERVEASVDRMIEQGRLAEERRAQILADVEARLDELVRQGLITPEQKELILQRLTD